MGVELIPSVLATTSRQLHQRLWIARQLSRHIHLDIMDGVFVTTKSISLRQVLSLEMPRIVDVHIMVVRPTMYLRELLKLQPRRIFVHIEVPVKELLAFIAVMKSHRIEVGLAINPQTSLNKLEHAATKVRHLLVMGVKPGTYHSRFITTTPKRIVQIRKKFPKIVIVCDGGVSSITITKLQAAGIDQAVVGSAVMLSDHPEEAWKKLKQLCR